MTLPKVELGDVIASRALEFRGSSGETATVSVEVGRPVRNMDAENECYWCPYRISGLGRERTRAMAGVDSAQALVLALHAIPAEMDAFARDHGGRVTWLGGDDLGFPDFPPRGVA
jgi:hypothetical protein